MTSFFTNFGLALVFKLCIPLDESAKEGAEAASAAGSVDQQSKDNDAEGASAIELASKNTNRIVA